MKVPLKPYSVLVIVKERLFACLLSNLTYILGLVLLFINSRPCCMGHTNSRLRLEFVSADTTRLLML